MLPGPCPRPRRTAWELGERLAAAGRLEEPARIRDLSVLDVAGLVRGDAVLSGVRVHATDPTPLPARFRLSKTGRPVPVTNSGGAATGAGGGRGCGPVHLRDVRPPPDGAVLVTATLDPALAADLPRLAGLVAETGNVLSHRGTDG